jgi:hypothetical protein
MLLRAIEVGQEAIMIRIFRSVLVVVLISIGCAGEIPFDPQSGEEIKRTRSSADCTLIVPNDPLSATGLATPYRIHTSRNRLGICDEANAGQAAFVQAAVIDPATGKISVYNPLVITDGTDAAVPPVVPTLPANAVVGIWFGFNGDNLTLAGDTANGKCVNGSPQIFGQVSFCNAEAFFAAANKLLAAGKLTPAPPAIGTGKDRLPCPTVRSFAVVDQDPSDNVTSTYLVTADGKLAQNTAANAAALAGATTITNASDNRLVSVKLDGALGCTPYTAPDLADPGKMVTAQPLNEISAAKFQAAPIALVSSGDPMVMSNGAPDLAKQNAYRAGVDQPPEPDAATAQADLLAWCQNLRQIAPARMKTDQTITQAVSSPDPAAATNLFTFLAQRFNASYSILGCDKLLNQPSPITLTTDANGVCTGATIN